MTILKTEEQLAVMRECGRIMKATFEYAKGVLKPGVTTAELDKLLEKFIESCGATAPCIGYEGYPAATCISLNDTVIHGIPSDKIVIENGDIVSIDIVVGFKGLMTDAARTFPVGEVSEEKKKLIKVTEECFFKAVERLRDGSPLGDIGYAVSSHAETNGFSVVRAFTGHGVGVYMHEDPAVYNYGKKGTGFRLKKGMTIAIEPMINAGSRDVEILSDGWTVKTVDGKPSAHYENTVAITDDGVEILTL